jgi:hypothetical protein
MAIRSSVFSAAHRTFSSGALVILICAMPLAIMLRGKFIGTDLAEIVDGALIRSSWAGLVSSVTVGIPGYYYRPAVLALHSFNNIVAGPTAWVFRGTNLLLHLANAVCLYAITRRLRFAPSTSIALASLFLVHPVAATVIGWAGDRSDLLALLGSLGFYLASSNSYERGQFRWQLVGAFSLLVALAAKETAAASLLVTYAAWAGHPRSRAWRRLAALHSAIVFVWIVWYLHVSPATPITSRPRLVGTDELALYASIHLEYLRDFLFPVALRLCDGSSVPAQPLLAIGSGVLVVLAVGWWAKFHASKETRYAVAWVFAFLLPTSGIFALRHVRADRYLYCALPGVIFIMIRGIEWLAASFSVHWRRLTVGVYIGWVVLLVARSSYFESNERLWAHEVAVNGACLEGRSNLAREAFARSDFPAAIAHADSALNPGPSVVAFVNFSTTLLYRGMSKTMLGLSESALADFAEARSRGDAATSREAAYQMGIIHLVAGRFSEAGADFADVLLAGTAHPATADSRLFLAYCLLKQGNLVEARSSYRAYVALGVAAQHSFRARLRRELESTLVGGT